MELPYWQSIDGNLYIGGELRLMWLLNELAKLNDQITLVTLYIFKPSIRFNQDILLMWEIKEVICKEIIRNGHPWFRNKD